MYSLEQRVENKCSTLYMVGQHFRVIGFLLIGFGGVLPVSGFSLNWEEWDPYTQSQPHLSGVTHTADGFVACGYGNTVLFTENGETWTSVRSDEQYKYLTCIAFWEGSIFVGGDFGELTYSPNGAEGTPVDLHSSFGHVRRLRKSGDVYLVITTEALLKGTDPTVLEIAIDTGVQDAVRAPFGWFALPGRSGEIHTSATGKGDWVTKSVPFDTYMDSLLYAEDKLVAVGPRGRIWTSTDGSTWNAHHLVEEIWLENLKHLDGRFIAVGRDGGIYISEDGEDWIAAEVPTDKRIRDVAFGGGQFLAVGDNGTRLSSADGYSWVEVATDPDRYALSDLAGGGYGGFFALHESGALVQYADRPLNDPSTGESRPAGMYPVEVGGSDWRCLASTGGYGDTLTVLGGPDGKLATSNNGVTWRVTDTGLTGDFIEAAVLLDNRYNVGLLVGEGGHIVRCRSDGAWESFQLNGSPDLVAVTTLRLGDDTYFAVAAESGRIWLIQAEGEPWETGSNLSGGIAYLVSQHGTLFAGNSTSLFRSFDMGWSWSPCTLPGSGAIRQFAGIDPDCFVVDDAGKLWQTAFGHNWLLIEDVTIPEACSLGEYDARLVQFGGNQPFKLAYPNGSIFSNAHRVDFNWLEVFSIGRINPTYFPWIYHETLGYLYVLDSFGERYFWSHTWGWMWTGWKFSPWYYSWAVGDWVNARSGI